MNWFMVLLNQFTVFAKANPVMAGLVGIWTASMITFIFIKVPSRLWLIIKGQLTTSVALNNSTVGYNLENFNAFLLWFQDNAWVRFSRTFTFDPTYDSERGAVIGIGEGIHFFTFSGRLFWLKRTKEGVSTGYQAQFSYQISIHMFGRNQKKLVELIEAFRYRPPTDMVGIYKLAKDGWTRVSDAPKRPLNTVVASNDLKRQLLEDITWFRENREYYVSRGLPYKRIILLHGVPGTGKTSLIKAVASYFGLNLCLVNLAQMSDDMLEDAFARAPKNSIVAMEDFDTADATKARAGMSVGQKKRREQAARVQKQLAAKRRGKDLSVSLKLEPARVGDKMVMGTAIQANQDDDADESSKGGAFNFHMLTLGGLLNAMDGLLSLDGTIIFMTTNRLDTIDEALVREGRVDASYEVGELEDSQIREYIHVVFPDFPEEDLIHVAIAGFEPILGCKLYALFDRHKHSAVDFIESIPRKEIILHDQRDGDDVLVGVTEVQTPRPESRGHGSTAY
jgi:hypothetical protein